MVKTISILIPSLLFTSLISIQNVYTCIADTKDVDLLINESMACFQQISDYTCTLEKKVNKDGVVYYDPEISVKFKKPVHYYFKWGSGKFKGQEIIFAENRYHNKIVAHSGGLLGFITIHLDPEGSIAMKRNHHSLRRSGMEKIFDILGESYNRYKITGYGSISLMGESGMDGRDVWVIQGEFPENMGFYAAKIILCLGKVNTLPLKITVYDWSGALYEEYSFHDLRINVGLDEKDFDPENIKYNFN